VHCRIPVVAAAVSLVPTPEAAAQSEASFQRKESLMETSQIAQRHEAWNKGKLVGQKAPFKLKEIWAIRIRVQMHERLRELALFDLGIDSKLRRNFKPSLARLGTLDQFDIMDHHWLESYGSRQLEDLPSA
jgi:hypothetical protein